MTNVFPVAAQDPVSGSGLEPIADWRSTDDDGDDDVAGFWTDVDETGDFVGTDEVLWVGALDNVWLGCFSVFSTTSLFSCSIFAGCSGDYLDDCKIELRKVWWNNKHKHNNMD